MISRVGGSWLGGVFVVPKEGEPYYVKDSRIKDVGKFEAKTYTIPVCEIEYPEDWWISFCKEEDMEKVKEDYNLIIDNTFFRKEVYDFKNGIHTEGILERIEILKKEWQK